jgi:hypothetical protein
MGAPGFFPVFGVLFILMGAGFSIYAITKANAYQQAYRVYRQRRAQLLGEQEPSDGAGES